MAPHNPIPETRLADFYAAVQDLPDMGRDFWTLLLFTGLRGKEAAALRWSEISFEERLIRLPAVRVKTRSALDLPMTSYVADMLIARRALGNGEFVFPSRDSHIRGDSWTKTLRKATGLRFSIHDARRTLQRAAKPAVFPGSRSRHCSITVPAAASRKATST